MAASVERPRDDGASWPFRGAGSSAAVRTAGRQRAASAESRATTTPAAASRRFHASRGRRLPWPRWRSSATASASVAPGMSKLMGNGPTLVMSCASPVKIVGREAIGRAFARNRMHHPQQRPSRGRCRSPRDRASWGRWSGARARAWFASHGEFLRNDSKIRILREFRVMVSHAPRHRARRSGAPRPMPAGRCTRSFASAPASKPVEERSTAAPSPAAPHATSSGRIVLVDGCARVGLRRLVRDSRSSAAGVVRGEALASHVGERLRVTQRLLPPRVAPSSRAGCASHDPSRRSARRRRRSGASARPSSTCCAVPTLGLQRELHDGHVRVRIHPAQRHPRAVIESAAAVDAGGDAGVLQQRRPLGGELGRAGRGIADLDRARREIRRNRGSFPASDCRSASAPSVSQCAEAISTARGRGSAAPERSPTRRSSGAPARCAFIGEPCERKSVGRRRHASCSWRARRSLRSSHRSSRRRGSLTEPRPSSPRCTCGRAATRAWNCCSAGHGARSTLSMPRPVDAS